MHISLNAKCGAVVCLEQTAALQFSFAVKSDVPPVKQLVKVGLKKKAVIFVNALHIVTCTPRFDVGGYQCRNEQASADAASLPIMYQTGTEYALSDP